jgi:hypothetical protein
MIFYVKKLNKNHFLKNRYFFVLKLNGHFYFELLSKFKQKIHFHWKKYLMMNVDIIFIINYVKDFFLINTLTLVLISAYHRYKFQIIFISYILVLCPDQVQKILN